MSRLRSNLVTLLPSVATTGGVGLTNNELLTLATRGGWFTYCGIRPGYRIEDPFWNPDRAMGPILRRYGSQYGTSIKLAPGFRWDLTSPAYGPAPWSAPGFKPEWVASEPVSSWLERWQPFHKAGWKLYFKWEWPEGLWSSIMGAIPSGHVPITYPIFDPATKTAHIPQVALDLRVKGCQNWLMREAIHHLDVLNADALLVGVKYMWWHHPQQFALTPENVAESGGAYQDTPFGPGEWEDACSYMFETLWSKGVPVIVWTTRRPDPDSDDYWDWIRPQVRNLLLGEISVGQP